MSDVSLPPELRSLPEPSRIYRGILKSGRFCVEFKNVPERQFEELAHVHKMQNLANEAYMNAVRSAGHSFLNPISPYIVEISPIRIIEEDGLKFFDFIVQYANLEFCRDVAPGRDYLNLKKLAKGEPAGYRLAAIGTHSESLEEMPIYISTEVRSFRHQLGLFLLKLAVSLIQEKIWIRPMDLFKQKFTKAE